MKKILLISPLAVEGDRTPKGFRIPEIALSIVASITPSSYEVEIVEEEIEDIDLNKDCDIVGISCMTANAKRGYGLAREFKRRGKTVVFGGVHPTVLPNEALKYGDSVIVGEAEGAWEEFLRDFECSSLKSIYRNFQPDVTTYPPPRRDLAKAKAIFDIKPIVTTRGCPYDCNFCCVPQFYGKKLRHLPVENVVNDIQLSGGKKFLFLDDNIIGKPKYAKELFRALIPLNIKWVGQASISFVKDIELMTLAANSGCVGLFFGLESVSPTLLKKIRKSIKDISRIEDSIKRVKDIGIHFHASLVFGFDDDSEATFDETLEFLLRNKIGTCSLNVMTPYPGTDIYKQFKEEDRLITEDWQYYDHCTVVYRPKNMTPEELTLRYLNMKKEFYSFSSMYKRFWGNLKHPLLFSALNIAGRSATLKEDYTKELVRLNELSGKQSSRSLLSDNKVVASPEKV